MTKGIYCKIGIVYFLVIIWLWPGWAQKSGKIVSAKKLLTNLKNRTFSGPLMSLKTERGSISKALKKVEQIIGLKFQIDSNVTEKVTNIMVNDLPCDQILDFLLDYGDLDILVVEGDLRIKKKDILEKRKRLKSEKKYIGQPINFTFKGIDIRRIVVDLMINHSKDYGRLEIIIYPGIKGILNCDFGKVPWDWGLNRALNQLGLRMDIEGNLMMIRKSLDYNKMHALSPQKLTDNLKNKNYSGQIIKLFVKEINLLDLFKYLEYISDLRFKVDKKISGKVTIDWMRGQWDMLLDFVLYSHNLELIMQKNTLRIKKMTALEGNQSLSKRGLVKTVVKKKPDAFSFENSDLEDVIRSFSDRYPLNFVFNPECIKNKKIDYNHEQIYWLEALKSILSLNDLEFEFIKGDSLVGDYMKIREKLRY